MAVIVVTGVDGFVGRHVVRAIRDAGHTPWGIVRAELDDDGLRSQLDAFAVADLTEEWPDGFFGDAVIHLAGLAAVGPSFDRPQLYLESNSAMVTTMGEAHLRAGLRDVRIIGVSSGSVYDTRSGSPLTESSRTDPSSPYVVSKLLVESQLAYYRTRGLDTTVVRPFNHVGPGQGPGFLVPDLARRLAELKPGAPLTVGNLAARRDYTDVRDVARAYVALCGLDSPAPVYNVASGASYAGSDILRLICAALERPEPAVAVDASLIRPTDPADVVGDAGLLRQTGWSPRIPLETSIADFVAALGQSSDATNTRR